MFDNIRNLGSIMKMAGQAREKAQELQAELEQVRVVGESGAGAVRVTCNGKGRAQRVDLDPNLLTGLTGGNEDDKIMVEELIAAAMNDAMDKVQAVVMDKTRAMTGDMNIPGLEGLLGEGGPPVDPATDPSDPPPR